MRVNNFKLSRLNLSVPQGGVILALPMAVMVLSRCPAYGSDLDRWQNFQKSGEEAFENQKWGKAERFFAKAVREADRTDVGDKSLALSLRKLGEANTAAHKYREAEAHLQRAMKVSKDCGADDSEAIRDLLELAKTYRSVNLEQFGKNVATVLKETGLDRIEILNTKDGTSRVIVKFADKFSKHINSADVNQINLDKKLTFDIHEDKDGTITLSNIKGLRVRSKVWVNLTQSSIDPNGNEGKPTALVTAEKLGLTRTVSTVLPKPVYDKIFAVVERIRHPELHSPWLKQLQERMGITAKSKQVVPVTVTNVSKDDGKESGPSGPESVKDSEKTSEKNLMPSDKPSADAATETVTGVAKFAGKGGPVTSTEQTATLEQTKITPDKRALEAAKTGPSSDDLNSIKN